MKTLSRWSIKVLFLLLALTLSACQPLNFSPQPNLPNDSDPVFVATPAGLEPATPTSQPAREPAPDQPGSTPQPAGGELYWVAVDPASATLSLVRLPDACLLAETDCPAVEFVPGFPNQNESVRPLAWSPDGRLAALPLETALVVYDPGLLTWKIVAQVRVSDAPAWSIDGGWLGFVGHDANQPDVYIVRPNGTELHNLTNGAFSGEGVHLAGLTWVGPDSLAFWHFAPQQRKELLELHISTGALNPLLTMSGLTKDMLVFSPDRQQIALESLAGAETQLIVTNADGSNQHVAARYTQASVWPLEWSPDGRWLVYSVYGSPNEPMTARMYVAPAGGSSEARELLKAENISSLTWGPDSRHVVVQADLAGRMQLFLVDIEDGSVTPLSFPSLPESAMMQGVSWRFSR